MPKIAVLTAFNPQNAGMLSVDLAAEAFFSSAPAQVDFYRAQTFRNLPTQAFCGQEFRLLRDPGVLRDYDVIVYWGDFLNSPVYGAGDFMSRDLRMKLSSDGNHSFDLWQRLFLLKGLRGRHQKVVSVSNNFQAIGTALNNMHPAVRSEVEECFVSNFDAIFPRDPISTRCLFEAIPNAAGGRIKTGVDAAFLLDARAMSGAPDRATGRRFSYAFGRSGFKRTRDLAWFLSRKKWLLPLEEKRWLSIRRDRRGLDDYTAMLQSIGRSRFVITDIYHLCVNAMNIGAPVIGLGRATEAQVGSLGDHKKQTLFDMFEAPARYLTFDDPELGAKDFSRILEAVEDVARRDETALLRERIRRRTETYRQDLRSAIFGL